VLGEGRALALDAHRLVRDEDLRVRCGEEGAADDDARRGPELAQILHVKRNAAPACAGRRTLQQIGRGGDKARRIMRDVEMAERVAFPGCDRATISLDHLARGHAPDYAVRHNGEQARRRRNTGP
jgi:hypothetical protein